jgi:putative transcriptional regulator
MRKDRKLNPKELAEWEATRDIGAELLEAVEQMNSGRASRVHRFKVSETLQARNKLGLSREKFASVLGVSTRTLEAWEQGRRQPTGAARSLLRIALKRPEVLIEALS